ncbi:metallophosphoesterase [Providencia hangzhouensis]|uniref:metallophosphoesterase n=1 Tax=Providencia hangzhouensis TaxID=3031799 RepID=UPI0034DCD2B4
MIDERNGFYQRINVDKYESVYVVGDLHGCFDSLASELKSVNFNENTDLLISVGDLIDRGERSIDCLGLIKKPWFKAVRGNHEQMAISALLKRGGGFKDWILNGGKWYLALSDEDKERFKELLQLAANLPLVIEVNVNGKKIVIAHADYPGDEYVFGADVDYIPLLWGRERLDSEVAHNIKGADLFLFGHTPVNNVIKRANQEYIDTGVVFGRSLTLRKIK